MRVIVTRPGRDAVEWVQDLVQRGWDAVALPLIAIQPLGDPVAARMAWQRLASYSAVMFVSRSAVDHFFASRAPGYPDFDGTSGAGPFAWAPGPGTAAALRGHGVQDSAIQVPANDGGQFDSEALWALVGGSVRAGDRVLVVRGTDASGGAATKQDEHVATKGVGREWLAQRLQEAGASVDHVVVYQRGAPLFDAAQSALGRQSATDGSLWLFTSAQAVVHLGLCLPLQDWSGARALATHRRIAQVARGAGFGVVWESRPALSDVVASIESIA